MGDGGCRVKAGDGLCGFVDGDRGGDFTGGAVVGITGLVGGESAGAGGVHRMPERLSRRSNTGGAIGGKMAESALGCQGFE